MQTPATRALDAAGIAHRTTTYALPDDVPDGYGTTVALALGLDPDACGKTLVAVVHGTPGDRADRGVHVVAVVPVSGSLDLKALAAATGGKRAAMADPADAERVSGSVVGAISPLGLRRRLPVVVDERLVVGDEVHVSGGRRGLELHLAPADLVAACDALVAPIAR